MAARRWITLASAVALVAAVVSAVRFLGAGQAPVRVVAAATDPFESDAAIRDADIAFYESRSRADTLSAADLADLAQLYLRRARETGEMSDYRRAEEVSRRSLALRAVRNPQAELVLASSLLALHRFPEALAAAGRLCNDYPERLSHCALLAEIRLEMGDYSAARATFSLLAPFKGNLGVAPRLARWYEITGRTDDAFRLLLAARDDAERRTDLPREQVAWFHLRVGDIGLRNGDLARAAHAFRAGLRVAPHDPRLLAGLARHAALRHDWKDVIEFGMRAADRADITTLALIGDAYAALGRAQEAENQYRTVEEAARDNSEPFNRQWTLFRLDHDRETAGTLVLLRDEIRIRDDVYGWDQLAWAYYRAGDFTAARHSMDQALRMGTRDAVLFFHAGLIDRALGDHASAQRQLRTALELNPHFHHTFPAWARATLDSIDAGR